MSGLYDLTISRPRTNKEVSDGMQRILALMKRQIAKRNAWYDELNALGLDKAPFGLSEYSTKGDYTISFLGTEHKRNGITLYRIYDLTYERGKAYFQDNYVGLDDRSIRSIRVLRDTELPLYVNKTNLDSFAQGELKRRLRGESKELPILDDMHAKFKVLKRKEGIGSALYSTYRTMLSNIAARNKEKGTPVLSQVPRTRLVIGEHEYLFDRTELIDPIGIMEIVPDENAMYRIPKR